MASDYAHWRVRAEKGDVFAPSAMLEVLARLAEAERLLRAVEWEATPCVCCLTADAHAGCPACGAWLDSAAGHAVHADDCALARWLESR